MAGFEKTVGYGKRVIEDRVVGEIAHGEIVNPPNRACMTLAGRVDALDGKHSCEHGFTVTEEGMDETVRRIRGQQS